MGDAREEILGRVRRAVAGAAEPGLAPRGYRDPPTLPPAYDSWVDLFVERVEDYRATVHRCGRDDVTEVLARLLDGPTVVSPGFPWPVPHPLPDTPDHPLTHAELDAAYAVVTTAALGIATTGTLVLVHGPGGQGRRAISLVPDRHVCVLMANQVVPGVPDAVGGLDRTRPQTWISGPSATSDIELDRVEGVHGPRSLRVVLVED